MAHGNEDEGLGREHSPNANSSAALLDRLRRGDELGGRDRLSLVARLSLPAIMAQLSTTLMQYIDASMVGALGATSSAAVGLVASSEWLIGWIATSAAVGFTVQVAQLVGARRDADARGVLLQGIVCCAAVGAVLALIGTSLAPGLPAWLGGDPSVHPGASAYFGNLCAGLPVTALLALTTGMLQASGDTLLPGLVNVLACVLDAILDAIFIYPAGAAPVPAPLAGLLGSAGLGLGWGVGGAALATVASSAIAVAVAAWALLRRNDRLRLRPGDRLHLRRETVACAARISVPVAIENSVFSGALVVTTKIVAPLGAESIAANSFATTAEGLCYMPGYGIGTAATTLVGQAIGAGRRDLARQLAWLSVGIGVCVMVCGAGLMFAIAPQVIGLLTPVPGIRDLGAHMLRIEAFAEPLYASAIVASGCLRGAGDTLVSSALNFSSLWLVRIPLSMVLVGRLGLTGVWLAMATELCVRGCLFLTRLRGRAWSSRDLAGNMADVDDADGAACDTTTPATEKGGEAE